MAEIAPFHGWRYDPERAGRAETLIAPPYDIISPSQQRALYARSPYNVIRLELTGAEPGDPPGVEGDAARHARAQATLAAWRAAGILHREERPALYLYRQSFDHRGERRSRRCLLAATRLHPWSDGVILPHEHTLTRPKAERLALLRATRANISPIWALYQDGTGEVAALLGAAERADPLLEATDDEGIGHTLWRLDEAQAVSAVVRALVDRPFFIADGHHRYETALAFQREDAGAGAAQRPADWVFMALTASEDPGLIVLPTHRLVSNVPAERLAALPDRLAERLVLEELAMPADGATLEALLAGLLPGFGPGPAEEHRFALLGPEPERLRLLRLRQAGEGAHGPAALAELDVWLAHATVLDWGLGIDAAGLERQEHLTYTRDAAEALTAVRSGACQLALFLPPTPVAQLLAVARAGGVMPQKSTYFYPKPATGLVLRLL